MVKFKAKMSNGRTGYGFGLSEENVKKLKEGLPIFIDGNGMGIDFDVMIFYGRTEEEIQADLQQFIGPDTKYR